MVKMVFKCTKNISASIACLVRTWVVVTILDCIAINKRYTIITRRRNKVRVGCVA